MDPIVGNFVKDASLGFFSFLLGWIAKHLKDFKKDK